MIFTLGEIDHHGEIYDFLVWSISIPGRSTNAFGSVGGGTNAFGFGH